MYKLIDRKTNKVLGKYEMLGEAALALSSLNQEKWSNIFFRYYIVGGVIKP